MMAVDVTNLPTYKGGASFVVSVDTDHEYMVERGHQVRSLPPSRLGCGAATTPKR